MEKPVAQPIENEDREQRRRALRFFRFAGCAAFAGYSLALLQHSIWYRRSWWTTAKSMFDGLIYGLLTAGIFGWLWPR